MSPVHIEAIFHQITPNKTQYLSVAPQPQLTNIFVFGGSISPALLTTYVASTLEAPTGQNHN